MTNELIADGIYRVSGMETSLKNGAWVSDAGTYLVTNQTKLADIPDARPGDIAFTAGYGHIWQLDVDSTTWVELPKTAAGTAATQAAASATAAAGSASAAAASASQAQTVAASIPADYTDLSNSVVDLKSAIDTGKIIFTPTWTDGTINDQTGEDESSSTIVRTDFIPVEVLDNCNVYIDGDYSVYYYRYRSNNASSYIFPAQSLSNATITKIEPGANCKYIKLRLAKTRLNTTKYERNTQFSLSVDDKIAQQDNAITALDSKIDSYNDQIETGRIPYTPEWVEGTIDATTGEDQTSDTTYRTGFIDKNLFEGCNIGFDGTYSIYYYQYSDNTTGSYMFPAKQLSNATTTKVTINSNCKYIRFTIGRARVDTTSFERNSQMYQAIIVNAKKPEIIMPDTIVALVDEEFDIHYDNIISNFRAVDMPYKEAFGGAEYIGMKDIVRFCSSTAGVQKCSIYVGTEIPDARLAPSLPSNVYKKQITVKTISQNSGTGVTRKVLFIGDSWTAPGRYALEVKNLFENSDEPMNVTLLGTLGAGGAEVGPTNGYHEGHGAFSSKTFCTKASYNGYNNYFYNPSTSTFDFSYYMSHCEYTGVDDVFINLGINDVVEMKSFDDIISYYTIMINSIRTYDSDIRIFIGLCGLPAQYGYELMNDNCNRSKRIRLEFHNRLMAEYGGRENEGFFIVPLHLSIDNEHDFSTEQHQRSHRDTTLVDYCTDNVHPTLIAYYKMADRIRTYIKYAETVLT